MAIYWALYCGSLFWLTPGSCSRRRWVLIVCDREVATQTDRVARTSPPSQPLAVPEPRLPPGSLCSPLGRCSQHVWASFLFHRCPFGNGRFHCTVSLFLSVKFGGPGPCSCYLGLGKLQVSFCSCVLHNFSSFYFSRFTHFFASAEKLLY